VAKGKDTVARTFVVALMLCIVCSVVVSAAAISLRPDQIENRKLDIKTNILSAAGMLRQGMSSEEIDQQFARFEVHLVDLKTGEYVEPSTVGAKDAMSYDQRKASADPAISQALSAEGDPAGIKRQADVAKVFVLKDNGELKRVVLPVHGYGLWSTLYGFISLEGDLNTIEGLGFYSHAETPGLGGEVDNPRWKAQWVGKEVYGDSLDEPQIRLVKGGVSADAKDKEHKIDALSGATLTSRGVEHLVNFWMGDRGFEPYLNKLRQGEA